LQHTETTHHAFALCNFFYLNIHVTKVKVVRRGGWERERTGDLPIEFDINVVFVDVDKCWLVVKY
jgi:hypothetical protein